MVRDKYVEFVAPQASCEWLIKSLLGQKNLQKENYGRKTVCIKKDESIIEI